MPDASYVNLLIVVAIAFGAPLLIGMAPRVRVPGVVVEIVAGIVVGPAGFGWVDIDEPVRIIAMLGLAFLLFLAGLEIDIARLRGPVLRLAGGGFLVSIALALTVGFGLDAAGLAGAPLLVAIVLASTGLGVVVPVLKDAGEASTPFGQLVIAAASIADFGAIVFLSVLFSRESSGPLAQLAVLGAFVAAAVAITLAVRAASHGATAGAILRLQDTTAQIRVRGAVLMLVGLVAIARGFGLEIILGAFAAGAILGTIDRDERSTHPHFRTKLDGIGYGLFVPVFFVASGLRFDLGALFGSAATVATVPVYLVALLLVRGLPAMLYRREIGSRRAFAAGLLQATSLTFVVAATQIGIELGAVTAATSAALVAAGLASVVVFPLAAVLLLGSDDTIRRRCHPVRRRRRVRRRVR